MIIELEINGARVIISGDNLTVNVSQEAELATGAAHYHSSRHNGLVPTADEIKALRHRLGINQAQLADMVGVSHPATVCKWERGYGHPSGAAAIALVRLIEGAAA